MPQSAEVVGGVHAVPVVDEVTTDEVVSWGEDAAGSVWRLFHGGKPASRQEETGLLASDV